MKLLRLLLVLLPLGLPLAAAPRMQNAPKAPPPPQGFTAEFLQNLDEVEEKILDLAESTPPEKYGWRPGAGVRSISEVYMHIAGANYFLASFLGTKAPPQNGDIEKSVTRKADVVAELRKSFDHVRSAARTTDLEVKVKMFGSPTTHRGVLITILNHLHEHLGQSIAYARMNGVVPPWSR